MHSTGSIRLVAGLTSSGKSSYLKTMPGAQVVMGSEVEERGALWLPDGVCLHYNTLRYAANGADNVFGDFFSDPALRALVASGRPFETDYVFCRPGELLDRVARRVAIEDGHGVYPSTIILQALCAVDLPSFHAAWLALLRSRSRNVRLIHAAGGCFEEVAAPYFTSIVELDPARAARL